MSTIMEDVASQDQARNKLFYIEIYFTFPSEVPALIILSLFTAGGYNIRNICIYPGSKQRNIPTLSTVFNQAVYKG